MTGQTRKLSAIEAVMNVLIGYGIAIVAQLLIFPRFGGHFSLSDNLQIGALFTVVSLLRSYCLRRMFNWISTKELYDNRIFQR
jgi:hypothetical protein